MKRSNKVALPIETPTERYLSAKDVADRYSVHQASVWGWAKDDECFPKPVKLSGRCTRWKLSDLLAWERNRETAA